MAERSNAAVLKTVDCHRSGGSNPSLSASSNTKIETLLTQVNSVSILWLYQKIHNSYFRRPFRQLVFKTIKLVAGVKIFILHSTMHNFAQKSKCRCKGFENKNYWSKKVRTCNKHFPFNNQKVL